MLRGISALRIADALLRLRSQDATAIIMAQPGQLTKRTNLIRSSSSS